MGRSVVIRKVRSPYAQLGGDQHEYVVVDRHAGMELARKPTLRLAEQWARHAGHQVQSVPYGD